MNIRSSSYAVAAVLFLANCSAENLPASTGSGGSPAGGSSVGGGSAGLSTGGNAGNPSSAGAGGGGTSAGGATAGGTAGAVALEPSFSMLKGVIQSSCFGSICHDLPEHPLQLKVDDKLYGTLTTHMTKECGPVVTPGSPADSALVKLLKGPCGKTTRMPYGKCSQDGDEGCVPPETIAVIEKWIANGAPP